MQIDFTILIIAAAVWISAEEYLIIRDYAYKKGKTKADQRTRIYNALSLTSGIGLAALISWSRVFRFTANRTSMTVWIGVAIMCSGLFLRHWSIHVLGKYFRTTVELDKEQRVIQEGPYKYVRHPSYSGIVLFCIGYGLVAQSWLSLLIVVVLPTISLLYRIHVEEKALLEGIGDEYKQYQSKTKKLIPGIW